MADENRPPAAPCVSPFLQRTKALYEAIEGQDAQLVDNILRKFRGSIDPNGIIVGMEMTFLHLAVGLSDNSVNIVRSFLRLGGDPNNMKCVELLSPLHLSVLYDYEEVLDILLIHGGDPSLRTGDGKSCYDIVLDNNNKYLGSRCFNLLLKRCSSFRNSLKNQTMEETANTGITDISELTFSYSDDDNDHTPLFSTSTPIPKNQMDFRQKNSTYSRTGDESHVITTKNSQLSELNSQIGNNNLAPIPEDSEPFSLDKTDSVVYSGDSYWEDSTLSSLMSSAKKQLGGIESYIKKFSLPPATSPIRPRFQADTSDAADMFPFSTELHLAISDLNVINYWAQLKINLLQETSTKRSIKSFFNYILLDSKIIQRANFSGNHLKSDIIKNSEKFKTFLTSVFYVGKGSGNKPIQPLVEAKDMLSVSKHKRVSGGENVAKIIEIWKAGLGVIVCTAFPYSSETEANVNQACMVDALCLVKSASVEKEKYPITVATKWSQKTKNQFGAFLLYKSFCSFVVSDTKNIYPSDI